MPYAKSPATGVRGRAPVNIKAVGTALDTRKPSEALSEFQSEKLALDRLMRRFCISVHHARVVAELAGIGGAA